MKTILEKIIDGKIAKLTLGSDGITVRVIYNGETLSSSAGGTWWNISESGMQEQYLDMTVEEYLKDKEERELFEKECENIDWGEIH